MVTTDPESMTKQERDLFRVMADLLIPNADGMPAASDVGVHEDGIALVIEKRPDLAEPLGTIIEDMRVQGPPSSLTEFQERYPNDWAQIGEAVAGAYFLHPDVASRIGYERRQRIPLGDPQDLIEELTELTADVSARGFIWRSTDEAS